MKINIFQDLTKVFRDHNFSLFMVGGTSRDYLLGIGTDDFDLVTDATPDEMKSFLPDGNFAFEKFGNVKLKIDECRVDITTLREEGEYVDFRHPSYIKFVRSLDIDYKRRDFTINAIYIDENLHVIDKCGAIKDLENKVIRFIGNPQKRVEEDPLRILRGKRFKEKLGFDFEPETKKAIENNDKLLEKLNKDKIKEELSKFKK